MAHLRSNTRTMQRPLQYNSRRSGPSNRNAGSSSSGVSARRLIYHDILSEVNQGGRNIGRKQRGRRKNMSEGNGRRKEIVVIEEKDDTAREKGYARKVQGAEKSRDDENIDDVVAVDGINCTGDRGRGRKLRRDGGRMGMKEKAGEEKGFSTVEAGSKESPGSRTGDRERAKDRNRVGQNRIVVKERNGMKSDDVHVSGGKGMVLNGSGNTGYPRMNGDAVKVQRGKGEGEERLRRASEKFSGRPQRPAQTKDVGKVPTQAADRLKETKSEGAHVPRKARNELSIRSDRNKPALGDEHHENRLMKRGRGSRTEGHETKGRKTYAENRAKVDAVTDDEQSKEKKSCPSFESWALQTGNAPSRIGNECIIIDDALSSSSSSVGSPASSPRIKRRTLKLDSFFNRDTKNIYPVKLPRNQLSTAYSKTKKTAAAENEREPGRGKVMGTLQAEASRSVIGEKIEGERPTRTNGVKERVTVPCSLENSGQVKPYLRNKMQTVLAAWDQEEKKEKNRTIEANVRSVRENDKQLTVTTKMGGEKVYISKSGVGEQIRGETLNSVSKGRTNGTQALQEKGKEKPKSPVPTTERQNEKVFASAASTKQGPVAVDTVVGAPVARQMEEYVMEESGGLLAGATTAGPLGSSGASRPLQFRRSVFSRPGLQGASLREGISMNSSSQDARDSALSVNHSQAVRPQEAPDANKIRQNSDIAKFPGLDVARLSPLVEPKSLIAQDKGSKSRGISSLLGGVIEISSESSVEDLQVTEKDILSVMKWAEQSGQDSEPKMGNMSQAQGSAEPHARAGASSRKEGSKRVGRRGRSVPGLGEKHGLVNCVEPTRLGSNSRRLASTGGLQSKLKKNDQGTKASQELRGTLAQNGVSREQFGQNSVRQMLGERTKPTSTLVPKFCEYCWRLFASSQPDRFCVDHRNPQTRSITDSHDRPVLVNLAWSFTKRNGRRFMPFTHRPRSFSYLKGSSIKAYSPFSYISAEIADSSLYTKVCGVCNGRAGLVSCSTCPVSFHPACVQWSRDHTGRRLWRCQACSSALPALIPKGQIMISVVRDVFTNLSREVVTGNNIDYVLTPSVYSWYLAEYGNDWHKCSKCNAVLILPNHFGALSETREFPIPFDCRKFSQRNLTKEGCCGEVRNVDEHAAGRVKRLLKIKSQRRSLLFSKHFGEENRELFGLPPLSEDVDDDEGPEGGGRKDLLAQLESKHQIHTMTKDTSHKQSNPMRLLGIDRRSLMENDADMDDTETTESDDEVEENVIPVRRGKKSMLGLARPDHKCEGGRNSAGVSSPSLSSLSSDNPESDHLLVSIPKVSPLKLEGESSQKALTSVKEDNGKLHSSRKGDATSRSCTPSLEMIEMGNKRSSSREASSGEVRTKRLKSVLATPEIGDGSAVTSLLSDKERLMAFACDCGLSENLENTIVDQALANNEKLMMLFRAFEKDRKRFISHTTRYFESEGLL